MSYKVAAVATIVGAVAIVGAYTLGQQQSKAPSPAPVASAPAGTHAATGGQEVREGKVGVDPNEKFTHFRVGNKNVKKIYADQGVVWVATSGGVIRYDTRTDKFKLYDNQTGLLSNGMFYVGRVQGKITVGTYGGGMSMLDEATGTWETYNIPEGLGDAFVYDVVETRTGDIWIATWSGVNRVRGGKLKDPSAWELYTVENTDGGLPNDWVYGLAEGKNGEMWLATEGGMARFVEGKWDNWNHARGIGADYERVKQAITFKSDPAKESLHHAQQKREMGLEGIDQAYNPNYIISLVVDADGTVWSGTWGGGLAHFDGEKWTNYTTTEGLPGNHVFMLHRDQQNRLWVGTNSGLAVKEGNQFRIMKSSDGLFNDTVFSMTTTKEGDLWIGSYGGVAHIRPAS
ncbi:ligand-binding sensor domain-containing protein [Aromatoleum evansii]|uniref:Two-component regulator propeller domain-containing protein n=1 Tax=Aromatoleum evansii TaxID=59406 RepID=A0ABZ1AQA0_AROEV|nr:two-component regulator propeller domain-containing protein [Aromatoleum evansii]NMG30709.1 regulator [Aromatoleum evansii]WRL46721.1 two-component regulator propeller domain-containing protein [Aromatoleum evansii]